MLARDPHVLPGALLPERPASKSADASLASFLPALALRALGDETDGPLAGSGYAAILFADLIGFTSLAESLSDQGPRGAEELSRIVHAHFGELTTMVLEAGGDVLAYAGDAALAAWPAASEADLTAAVTRASHCALRLQEAVEHRARASLRMRASVGAGDLTTMWVGGAEGRWMFLASGEAVTAATATDALAGAGEVVLSPRAAALLGNAAVGTLLEGGALRQARLIGEVPAPAPQPEAVIAGAVDRLRPLVPEMIAARLEAGLEALIGEFRRVTMVFCGLGGLEMERPGGLDRLHRAVAALQAVVARFEGTVYQLLTDDKGTTLVAAFGLPPRSHEDDAARGAIAALAMHQEVTHLGVELSVGVATGQLFCGIYGTAQRRQYTVAGPAINLAARLMQHAGGALLTDDETRRQAREHHGLRFAALPPLRVKGRAEPLAVHRPSVSDRQRAAAEGQLVGRDLECARLDAALDAAGAGQGGLVFLEGEPGIGKSQLIQYVRAGADARGLLVMAGAGSDIDKAAYHAWRPALKGLAGGDRALVGQRLRLRPDQVAILPLLGPLLSMDLGTSELVDEMSDEIRADNLRALLLAVLAQFGGNPAAVVLMEDAQWCDSPSLHLLVAATRNVPTVLFVVTSRPLDEPSPDLVALADGAGDRRMVLQALAPDAVGKLLAHRLGARTMPEPVRALVFERAAGNPFHSQELAYVLRDYGLIVVEEGRCRVADPARELSAAFTEALASRGLPGTVQGLVTSRIDRLEQAEQFVVRVASVIGRSFSVAMLGEVHPRRPPAEALDASLATLARLDILRPEAGGGEPRFSFRHAITHQVAYDLTPFAQRRELHQAVGTWLESHHAEDLAPVLPLLALHWRRAEVTAKAVEYLGRAGEQAFQGFANAEAVGLLRDALELGRDAPPPMRLRWEMQAGRACVNWSRYAEGTRHLEQGLALSGERVPHGAMVVGGLLGQIVRQILHRYFPRWFVGRRVADSERLLAAAQAHESLVEVHYLQNANLSCLYAALRGLNVAELAGRSPELTRGYATVGVIAGFVPLAGVADAYCQRALETAQVVGDLPARVWASLSVGVYRIGVGAWEEAHRLLDFVITESSRLGDSRRWMDGAHHLAAAHHFQGQFEESLRWAGRLAESGTQRNDPRAQASALQRTILALLALGRTDDVAAHVEEVGALRWDGGPMLRELPMWTLRALVAERAGDPDAALVAARAGAEILAKLTPSGHENIIDASGITDVLLGVLEANEIGTRRIEAERALKPALAALRRVARPFTIARPWLALHEGRAERLRGREELARRRWRAAVTLAQLSHMPEPEARAHLLTRSVP